MGPDFPDIIPITLYNFTTFHQSHLSSFPPSESFFFCSGFAQQLLIHPWRPAGIFAPLPPCREASCLSLEKVILEHQPASLGPLPSRALCHWAPLSSALKRPESALLKSREASLLCALLTVLSISSPSTSWSHYALLVCFTHKE